MPGEKFYLKNLIQLVEIPKMALKEAKTIIEVLHAGEWKHPQYGMIKITEDDIDKFVRSFENKVRKEISNGRSEKVRI